MQISEEEKKAIEIVKEIPHNHHEEIFMSEDLAIARVLNIIEKQQAEYSDLKLKYEQGLLLHKKHVSDLEIKDKMIYEMAKEILKLDEMRASHEYDKPRIWETEKGIKEYFRKKVEE